MENTKKTCLFLRAVLRAVGYILEKVAKLHSLENPQTSLKTRQLLYQQSLPFVFFGGSFFKIKIADILKF